MNIRSQVIPVTKPLARVTLLTVLTVILSLTYVCAAPMEVQADDTSDDIATLTELIHWFMDGASRNDRSVHARFWNEDLVYTSSAGTRFGKAEIMSGFDSTRSLRDAGPATQYTADEITVRVFGSSGDVAVVTFRMKGEVLTTQGISTAWYLNSGTFVREEGRWSAVQWQATRVP